MAEGCGQRKGGDTVAVLEMILLILVPASAAGILFSSSVRTAVGSYMVFSLLLAILWWPIYGLRLALTELGVGMVVTGLLLHYTLHRLRGEKGEQNGSEEM